MDHKIDELPDCIFDFLSSCPDTPKGIAEIWNCITGSTGHRCSELNNSAKKDTYKRKFYTECYSLDTKFSNIHKIFKNNKILLVYSARPKSDVMLLFEQYTPSNIDDMTTHAVSIDDMVEYIINNYEEHSDFDMCAPVNTTDNIIQHLVKHNKNEQFKKILSLFEFDIHMKDSTGKTLLEIAQQNNNNIIIRELIQHEYDTKLGNLIVQNQNLKKYNTSFMKQQTDLVEKNLLLSQQVREQQKGKWLMRILVVILATSNILSMAFKT